MKLGARLPLSTLRSKAMEAADIDVDGNPCEGGGGLGAR